ncbi:microfibril-associated glycoprotein 4-like [Asterias rubens]|uniref:microfibril-associated glycoprotein 4-like n=1 Tax=Asterias rubens TaxID=7604 RepID=UPI001454E45E|nr:microfibril-associated glycoprotein 4-like [Asterias rubens]
MGAIVLALTLLLMVLYCQSENPQRFISTMYQATNRVLENHVFRIKTVSSHVICGRDCVMDPQCASFNYQINNRICEFNNFTRANCPDEFIESRGNVYFDEQVDTPSFAIPNVKINSSCLNFYQAGYRGNGIYTIYPTSLADGVRVYCDMETDGGGWIVFQRRQDGSVDFYRNWTEYQSGFGDLSNEFWLGNDILRDLTGSGQWELRVDMGDWQSNTSWASYGEFAVTGDKYTLHVGSYDVQSTAGDSMAGHNGLSFTTKDQDNDIKINNCAMQFKGAWWYGACFVAHLNGRYYHRGVVSHGQGIQWHHWTGFYYSLKSCSMNIRQVV